MQHVFITILPTYLYDYKLALSNAENCHRLKLLTAEVIILTC